MDPRPDGIEVAVVHQARNRTPPFNQDTFVAALKHVFPLAMISVEAVGGRPLQLFRSTHQIRRRRFDGELKVITHHRAGV